jgi:hypothetical protein
MRTQDNDPLLPKALVPKQKLSPIDSAMMRDIAIGFGTGVSGSLVAAWVWAKAVQPRKKSKLAKALRPEQVDGLSFRIETFEQRVTQVRKTVRVTMSRFGRR